MQASRSLFAIVISEKGGAERREVFDRTELSVGRVQGNELMLPKGNVSKRHARLVYRDGRFIVSDLNSTNGTYVNRRRISQATIVREGDRIYIGDFVLRIEMPDSPDAARQSADSLQIESAPTSSSVSQPIPEASLRPPQEPPSAERSKGYLEVPKPPKAPRPAGEAGTPGDYPSSSRVAPVPMGSRPSLPSRSALGERRSTPDRPISFSDETTGGDIKLYRTALGVLVAKVLETVTIEETPTDAMAQAIDRVLREQLNLLESSKQLPRNASKEKLQSDAKAELLDTGPLRALLQDPDATEIVVPRFDQLEVRRGSGFAPIQLAFSSESMLLLALQRLCREAGAPLIGSEGVLDVTLPDGANLSAVLGKSGAFAVIRKSRELPSSLDQLVRSGVISRAMVNFLQQALAARLNILVVGSRDASPDGVVGALCVAAPERIVLHDLQGVTLGRGGVVQLNPDEDGGVLQVAARMPESRLALRLHSAAATLAVFELANERASGLLATVCAPNLRRALNRIPAELAAARPGLTLEAAREWVAGTFEIVIELARLRDGRERVLRVSEIVSAGEHEIESKDIFVFAADRTAAGGSIEGSFAATGFVPRSAEDMASRGFSLDSSLFNRPASR